MKSQRSLYEPALDGLRLVAFLAVFLHHLPAVGIGPVIGRLQGHGWAGVELFFVISSFLLFRLLEAEYRRTGTIAIGSFYARRVLRIYPLMVLFAAAMFALGSDHGREAIGRFLGIATFTDNVLSAAIGYNLRIPATGHLWTLGFEFQIYLALPFAFLAWKRWGDRAFLLGLGAFYALCLAARTAVAAAGVGHPVVWVLPVLQPDAILIGIVLATGALDRVPRLVWPPLFLAALIAFLLTPAPWTGPVPGLFSYALIALASSALIQTVRGFEPPRRLFSLRPVIYLGIVSFGLYVFHILGIEIAQRVLALATGSRVPADLGQTLVVAALGLAVTIGLSALSYRWLELPFLKLKDRRFAVVHGRPVSAGVPDEAAAGARPAEPAARPAPGR